MDTKQIARKVLDLIQYSLAKRIMHALGRRWLGRLVQANVAKVSSAVMSGVQQELTLSVSGISLRICRAVASTGVATGRLRHGLSAVHYVVMGCRLEKLIAPMTSRAYAWVPNLRQSSNAVHHQGASGLLPNGRLAGRERDAVQAYAREKLFAQEVMQMYV